MLLQKLASLICIVQIVTGADVQLQIDESKCMTNYYCGKLPKDCDPNGGDDPEKACTIAWALLPLADSSSEHKYMQVTLSAKKRETPNQWMAVGFSPPPGKAGELMKGPVAECVYDRDLKEGKMFMSVNDPVKRTATRFIGKTDMEDQFIIQRVFLDGDTMIYCQFAYRVSPDATNFPEAVDLISTSFFVLATGGVAKNKDEGYALEAHGAVATEVDHTEYSISFSADVTPTRLPTTATIPQETVTPRPNRMGWIVGFGGSDFFAKKHACMATSPMTAIAVVAIAILFHNFRRQF